MYNSQFHSFHTPILSIMFQVTLRLMKMQVETITNINSISRGKTYL